MSTISPRPFLRAQTLPRRLADGEQNRAKPVQSAPKRAEARAGRAFPVHLGDRFERIRPPRHLRRARTRPFQTPITPHAPFPPHQGSIRQARGTPRNTRRAEESGTGTVVQVRLLPHRWTPDTKQATTSPAPVKRGARISPLALHRMQRLVRSARWEARWTRRSSRAAKPAVCVARRAA